MGRKADKSRYRCRATITGPELRALREANHMSTIALGEEIGVSGTAVRQWETGRSEPPCWIDRAIVDVFGVPA